MPGSRQLGEIDYLLHSPDDRAGALSFGRAVTPPAPIRTYNRTVDLARLQALADQLISEEISPETTPVELAQVQDLLLLGTSMGGARPKVVVEDEGQLWIAKFNRIDDPWNHARVEHAMLVLARECGLTTAESRLTDVAGRDVLLVKRFDREPQRRYLSSRSDAQRPNTASHRRLSSGSRALVLCPSGRGTATREQ